MQVACRTEATCPLCVCALSFLATALNCNTQGKNMCKLFKQFGQFGNTLNRRVLLLGSNSANCIRTKRITCLMYNTAAFFFLAQSACCRCFLDSFAGFFQCESFAKIDIMKYKCEEQRSLAFALR